MIQGHGNSNAAVMFVADGGSPACAESNYALTGYNEITLQQLSGDNVRVRDTYRTLLIKERINATDFDSYKELITDQYKSILLEEIRSINPYLIVPLGEASFHFLTGLHDIRRFRGSVLPSNCLQVPKKVLPILGPNPYLNQEYQLRWISQIDLAKIPRYSSEETLPPDQTINCWIARTSSALRNFLERSYTDDGLLVFDIETFLGIPTCISFCFDGRESVCVPFMDQTIDLDNRVLMLGLIARILASKIRKVNQNITYDWRILLRFNFNVNNISGDTSIGATVLLPELDRNLGFLTSIYTDLPYFKNEGKEFDPKTVKGRETFYLYNAKDSLAAWQIHEKQQAEINEVGCRYVYDSLVSLIPIYKRMEDRGLRVDEERREFLLARYESKFNIETIKLRKMANDPSLNPLSSLQMNRLVFDELGFHKNKYVKDTGEEALEWLIVFGEARRSPIYGKAILQSIINCRKLHKVIELLNIIRYPDGRIKATYNLGGAETGRTTSGKNKTEKLIINTGKKMEFKTLGHSFQNLGKHGFMIDGEIYGTDLRSQYVPTSGYSFVEVDLSQAEARVDAVLAGNFDILGIFDGPIGIHKLTGSWVFDCDPLEIKKDELVPGLGPNPIDRYHMAKTVRHAAERNMQSDRLVLMIQCNKSVADEALRKIHDKQPEIIQVFHREIRLAIDTTRALVAPNGRRRQFLSRVDQHLYNEAISQLPQCIVSDQMKFALPEVTSKMPEAYFINEAHDGVLAEVPEGREEEYGMIYKKAVETEIDFNKCTLVRDFKLIIPCEVSVSKTNWQEMREIQL